MVPGKQQIRGLLDQVEAIIVLFRNCQGRVVTRGILGVYYRLMT